MTITADISRYELLLDLLADLLVAEIEAEASKKALAAKKTPDRHAFETTADSAI